MRLFFSLVVIAGLTLSALSTTTAQERKLKINDAIQLIVFGEPSLGAQVKIDSSGSVNFPLIGNVQVAGKSATEVARQVEGLLEKDYIRDANVTVTVISEFIPEPEPEPMIVEEEPEVVQAEVVRGAVTVMGEVRNPGTVQFIGVEADILNIIAQTKGLTPVGNPKNVTVRRVGENSGVFKVNLQDLQESTEQFFVISGDTIIVPKRLF